jgi:Arylsulfatase A and related enzymes
MNPPLSFPPRRESRSTRRLRITARRLSAVIVLATASSAAALNITNGDFEGPQFFQSTETAASPRDFFHRQLWLTNGDGWYTSNNPDSRFFAADGGIDGSGKYGAKQNSANHRGMVNVISDGRQTRGVVTLHMNVLYRAAGGEEGLRIKVWGVRESTPGRWDGWIDLTGPLGNADGLDLRNFNPNLPVTDASQQGTTVAPVYTGTDFTQLFSGNQTTLGISPGAEWQPVSFNVDFGPIGYDQIIVGVAFHDSTGTPSGVDDLALQPVLPTGLSVAASPSKLQTGVTPISITWSSASPLPNTATYTITTDKAGYGPYDVTAQTVNGASSQPFVVNYDSSLGPITFTVTAESATGKIYRAQTTIAEAEPEITIVATPQKIESAPALISLSWNVTDAPANASYVITSNRTGIGPFHVTATTDAGGTSTTPVSVPYNRAVGDITFTLTITDPATGKSWRKDVVMEGPAGDLPNVLVVLVDDMGWSDLAPFGGEIHTPTMQRLADNGLRFRHFYNEARCAPTRCALLTGMHVQRSSTKPNHNLPPLRIDNNVTIAEMLKSIGYRTYHTGKWHVSEYQVQAEYTPLQAPTNRGFDYAFNGGLWGGKLADGVGGGYWNPNEFSLCPPDGEIVQIKYDGTDPRATVPYFKTNAHGDYMLEYFRHHFGKNDGRPFFAYLAFHAPHFHLSAPRERINRYTDVADSNPGDADVYRYEDGWDLTRQRRYERQLAMGIIPPGTRLSPPSPMPGGATIPAWSSLPEDRRNDLARRMATYAAMVEGIDITMGRVIADLEARGQLDNTIILFMSDNGGNYEQGLYGGDANPRTGAALSNMGQPNANLSTPAFWVGGGWANVNTTPFRYYKHHTHEGGIRTPFIVHWPAGIDPKLRGKWIEARGHVTDILPTLLDIAGIEYPDWFNGHPVDPLDGYSFLPVLQGGTRPQRDLFVEHEQNRALYRGDWKLVTKSFSAPAVQDLDAHTVELYNIKEDPTELNNLSFHRPEMLAEMITAFNAWVDSIPGFNSNRRIPQIATEPRPFLLRGRELIADTFDRSNADDLDASQLGVSGTLSGMNKQPVGNVYFEGFNPANLTVAGKKLRINGAAETGFRPNLDHPLVTQAGGYSVAFDYTGFNALESGQSIGIAAGLTAAQAAGGGAADSPNSFRGRQDLGQGVADCFVELLSDNTVRVWVHGQIRQTIPIVPGPGTLIATFKLRQGFNAGDIVDVSVVFRGKKIHESSFAWRKNGASYAGLSASAGTSIEIDNLILRPAFLVDTFVTAYNSSHGLNELQSGPDDDPDGDGRPNAEEWMLGTDPSSADRPKSGVFDLTPLEDGFALLHRRASAFAEAGVRYTIRYSRDLATPISAWPVLDPAQTEAIAASDSYEQVRIILPEDLRDENRLFFALVTDR